MANKVTAGNLPAKGPGRPKGSKNKTTALLKDAILTAAAEVGEDGKGKGGTVGYCRFLATREPKSFATLMARVLPTQVTGEDGGPIGVVFRTIYEQRGS